MINISMLLEQLKRFWPIALFTALGYLLIVALPVYIHAGGGNYQESARIMVEILSMQNPFIMAATIIVPFGTAMALFSYLFNEKATVIFWSFSDNKNQLFWTNVSAGLILNLVPLLVLCVAFFVGVRQPVGFELPVGLFPRGLAAGTVINSFPVVVGFFLRLSLSFAFYFSLFLLAATLSGNGLTAFLLSIFLPILPVFLYRVIMQIAYGYVVGLDVTNVFGNLTVFGYTNPLIWDWEFVEPSWTLHFIVFMVLTLVILIIANICFRTRKIDRAGEPIVFEPLKKVLIFLIAFAGMIVMGRFFMTLTTARLFMYCGFVIGFAITFYVSHMVFDRNFNVLYKFETIIPYVIIAVFLYVVLMLVMLFGTRFYTHKIPQQQAVTGVFLSSEGPWTEEDYFITNPETITGTIAFHERILDDMQGNTFWQSIAGDGRQFADAGGQYLYLAYQLRDGGIMFRRYALSREFIERFGTGLR